MYIYATYNMAWISLNLLVAIVRYDALLDASSRRFAALTSSCLAILLLMMNVDSAVIAVYTYICASK